MSTTRKLIIAFWVFIGCMLLWQFYSYNQGVTQEAVEHPRQEHFFFYNTNAGAVAPPAPTRHAGASVRQTGFSVLNNTPSAGSFTCQVTLKNEGETKAVNVQVQVRPYHGITLGDPDAGHAVLRPLSDNDPLAQLGQWVTFPDLDPGQSSTQSTVFIGRNDVQPGTNSDPEIVFQSDKAAPAH